VRWFLFSLVVAEADLFHLDGIVRASTWLPERSAKVNYFPFRNRICCSDRSSVQSSCPLPCLKDVAVFRLFPRQQCFPGFPTIHLLTLVSGPPPVDLPPAVLEPCVGLETDLAVPNLELSLPRVTSPFCISRNEIPWYQRTFGS